TYPITITPGFGGLSYTEYTKVWIDWNANGIFEDSELALDPGSGSTQPVVGNITVPSTATLGSARMRIGMTYYGIFGSGQIPSACGTFAYGEFEDYCLTIQSGNGVVQEPQNTWAIFPNPNQGNFVLSGVTPGSRLLISDVEGRRVAAEWIQSASHECNVVLPSGVYILTIEGDSGGKKLKMIVQ
ncbi:MAG: T9SS type A sorting domain-containing protein, partial [Bacteroidetes bacterium]|nr:T9SS type A sorting domain-containing protein [Bacteroidota bacterium]